LYNKKMRVIIMREIVEAFFKGRSIVNHHLASFNDFLPTHDKILYSPGSKARNRVIV